MVSLFDTYQFVPLLALLNPHRRRVKYFVSTCALGGNDFCKASESMHASKSAQHIVVKFVTEERPVHVNDDVSPTSVHAIRCM